MTLARIRWEIELGAAARPTGYFLHVFDDDETVWHRDMRRALRFASKHEAERFGFDHLDRVFAARACSADELVGEADQVSEDENDDLAC